MIIQTSAYKKSLHHDNLSIWTIEQRKSNKVFVLLKFSTRIDKLSQLMQLTPNKSTPRPFNAKQIERCSQHSNLNGKDLTLNWFSFKLNDFHHFSIFQLSSILLFCFQAIKKTFLCTTCVEYSYFDDWMLKLFVSCLFLDGFSFQEKTNCQTGFGVKVKTWTLTFG